MTEDLRLISIASGSKGNCTAIAYKDTTVLIDAGISCKRIKEGLANFGLSAENIRAVYITHEHSDHISGLPQLCKEFSDFPLIGSKATLSYLYHTMQHSAKPVAENRFVPLTGDAFTIGDLSGMAFKTSHDAIDPRAYSFWGGEHKATILTDTGCVTKKMLGYMEESTKMVLEANYDDDMLVNGPYPHDLKLRIASRYGHMANTLTGEVLCALKERQHMDIILGHRSEHNNMEYLVEQTVREICKARGCEDVNLVHGQPKESVEV